MQDNYRWEAQMEDGQVFSKGEFLQGAVRFSLIPTKAGLPQHDVVGVTMLRRFARGFINATGGGVREYVHCVVAKDFRLWVRSSDGVVLVSSPDYELYL